MQLLQFLYYEFYLKLLDNIFTIPRRIINVISGIVILHQFQHFSFMNYIITSWFFVITVFLVRYNNIAVTGIVYECHVTLRILNYIFVCCNACILERSTQYFAKTSSIQHTSNRVPI